MSNLDPALEKFADQFKSWRKGKTRTKYPQVFWNEICNLAKRIPIATIAQVLEINVHYLKIRVAQFSQECLTLAPIKISYPPSFSLEFQSKDDKTIKIRFQASPEELAYLIQYLS